MSRSWRGVRDGTPIHGESLCKTCQHAHIVTGAAVSEKSVICEAMYQRPRTVPFTIVTECSHYNDKTKPSLYQMQKIAYVMTTDPRGTPIGFVPNGQFRKQEKMDRNDPIIEEP